MLGIKSKKNSIKLSILWNLLISIIAGAVITLLLFILFFGAVQLISQKTYSKLMKLCYANTAAMMVTSLVILLVYLAAIIVIFTYRLNEITECIKKISNNIHKLTKGDFRDKLPIENENELGCLARDINIMSDQIDEYIKSEKKWNEERYHIITNISHDLKTPIMSIDGYIQLIKKKSYSDEKEFDAYCKIISNKSQELNNAINQLFELSKLNSEGFKLDKSVIRLKEFMEQIVITYIPLLEEKAMDVHILIKPDILINVDVNLMKRAFENIIMNAIKYASSGKYLDVKADQLGDRIVIHFVNYGPMIPLQDMEHIFDRYYREKKNLKSEGNGLGLAIAKTIVQFHDGSIGVTSEEEKTDFYIDLDISIK